MFKNNAIASASIKGSPAQFEQQLKEQDAGRARPRGADRIRREGGHRAADGRRLALRRPERDPRQHARVRHRPRARAGQSQREGPGRRPASRSIHRRRRAAPDKAAAHDTSRLRAEALGKSYRSRQVVKGPVARGHLRRGGRPARAERRRQDHGLLHDRRPGAVRRGPHPPRRRRNSPACRCTAARQLGVGYLPQEASVFRKLSVEDNILAILETRNGPGRRRSAQRPRSRRCSRSCTSATSARAAA